MTNRALHGKTTLARRFIILMLLVFVFVVLDFMTGSVNLHWRDLFAAWFHDGLADHTSLSIIREFRIPRVMTALLAGMALSVSGLQMQTIFRNPLAGPYVLGISSGASLGVAILVLGFWPALSGTMMGVPGNWAVLVAAATGAGIVLFLILAVSSRIQDIMTILILGLLFGSAVSAIVNILQYFSNEYSLRTFVLWNMGSLSGVSRSQLHILGPAILLGLFISLLTGKILNAMLLGETYAKTLGVNIPVARFFVFLSTSLLAGGITAFCGPIGFVGIAVPHLARIIFRTSNHHVLIPASMLLGALIMLVSDIICQLPGTEMVLPVNSVTALLGIPIVVWVVVRNVRITNPA